MWPPPIPPEKHYLTAWQGYKDAVRALIAERGADTVLEVGGGRSPLFAPGELGDLPRRYVVNDISAAELSHLPAGYEQLHADICAPGLPEALADVVFSRMVGEHVADGAAFHRNVYGLLRPGGAALHFVPILFAPPFVLNKLLPERLTRPLLARLFPARRDDGHPKFPARYALCRGPSRGMLRTLRACGYREVDVRVFYGHGYFARFPGLRELDDLAARWAAARDFFWLGSHAYIVATR